MIGNFSCECKDGFIEDSNNCIGGYLVVLSHDSLVSMVIDDVGQSNCIAYVIRY